MMLAGPTNGSSPRRRGTQTLPRIGSRIQRFIPAQAGNAPTPGSYPGSSPVHPRASGERAAVAAARPPFPAVHPRAGGERPSVSSPSRVLNGLSPRGRGTLRLVDAFRDEVRFIPARAGNAPTTSTRYPIPPVHPRTGGERASRNRRNSGPIGSSPRGRGTPPRRRYPMTLFRFIPARAGNAPRRCSTWRVCSVHPRAGGERFHRVVGVAGDGGSSPRGRGTPVAHAGEIDDVRFIPARAGNAGCARGRDR